TLFPYLFRSVAMPGFEEMHLLNVTVSSRHQGQGHARRLLAELYALSASFAATAVWLEVRESNARARALYEREGFTEAGRRRDYYPAPAGQREDAVLMTRLLVREKDQ
ncbi:MAG: GNAT family N-acetyltransferase, partial [Vitreoscilla sp.]